MCDREMGCGCRAVVVRTYRELRERQIPDLWAFDTAARIFRMHHPEFSDCEARFTIAGWIDENG